VYAHDGARVRTRRDVGGFGYLWTGSRKCFEKMYKREVVNERKLVLTVIGSGSSQSEIGKEDAD